MPNPITLNGQERGLRRRDIFGKGPLALSIFAASAISSILLSMAIFGVFKRGAGVAFNVHLDRVDVAIATLRVGHKGDDSDGGGFGAANVFRDGVLTPGHVAIAAAGFAAVAAATLQFLMLLTARPAGAGAGGVGNAAVAANQDPLAALNAAVKAATAATLRAFNVALLAMGALAGLAAVLAFPGALARVAVALMVAACVAVTGLAANVMLTTHEVERRKVPKRKPKTT